MRRERNDGAGQSHVGDDGHRWVVAPRRVDLLVRLLYAVCLLLVPLGVGFALFTHAFDHAHFAFERWPGFYGAFGFVAFVAVVYLGRWWRKVVQRPEDYDRPPPPRPHR